MNLAERANKDIRRITSDKNSMGIDIELISPSSMSITIQGIHTKIGLGVDSEGNMINSTKAHISFSEANLGGYSIRDENGIVNLNGFKINVKDSTGLVKNYIMQSFFPDETVGLISCIIEGYNG